MGGGSGGGGDTTTTQEPWEAAKPYLKRGYQRAEEVATTPQQYYQGQTFANLTPGQKSALNDISRRGQEGSEVGNAAQNYLADQQRGGGTANDAMERVLGGEYLRRAQAGDFVGGGRLRDTSGGGALDRLRAGDAPGAGNLNQTAGGGAIDQYLQGPGGSGGGQLNRVAGGDALQRYAQGQGGSGDLMGTSQGGNVAAFLGGRADPGQLRETAKGDFLNSNPYLDAQFDTAARGVTDKFQNEIMPGINASFGSAGRTGGGIHQLYAGEAAGQATDSLADLSADIYGGNYQAERDRMMGASNTLQQGYLAERGLQDRAGADRLGGYLSERGLQDSAAQARQQGYLSERGFQEGASDRLMSSYLTERGMQEGAANSLMGGYLAERGLQDASAQQYGKQALQGAALAPGLANMDFADLNARLGSQDAYQQQTQNAIDEQMERHWFRQNEKGERTQTYLNQIQGMPNYAQALQSGGGQKPSRLRGAAGGAALGASVGSVFPGYGTAIGAGIGGLAGLFGVI